MGEDVRDPEISWFHRSGRESGVSWWGERPTWARHLTYWVVALGLLSFTLFDTDAGPTTASNDDLLTFVWLVMVILAIAVAALIFTLREWNSVGLVRTVSRSLVLFTFILGFAASWLYFARRSESRSTNAGSSESGRSAATRPLPSRC